MSWFFPLSQVFGGCCCNVYLFEELTRDLSFIAQAPNLGTTVTLCQFILVLVMSLPSQLEGGLYLKKPNIPILKLLFLVLLYFVVSVLNNLAWRFGISVPLHIVFRSSSTVCSMIVGYLVGGKKYLRHQVFLCVLMTIGTFFVISQGPQKGETVSFNYLFLCGVLVLSVASFLGAYMGIYTENLYTQYGAHWRETLFYTHFMALPMFLVFSPALLSDLRVLSQSQPLYLGVPKGLAYLALNSATQVLCALGVNRLAGCTTSLTVAVILLTRKFASLAISTYMYGSSFTTQGILGSLTIVLSTVYYTAVSMKKTSPAKQKAE